MLVVALISTVLLLICMGFFMMGSLPLLVLKHDTPLDARFIREMFNAYYVAVVAASAIGSLSFALSGRYGVGLGLACLAALDLAARQWVIPHMDTVRLTMTADDAGAIRTFRRLHVCGMVVNLVLLVGFAFGMARVTL